MDEIQIAKKLIEIESISPEDNGCFDVIKSELKDLKFKFEQIDYLNIKNLIIHREKPHQKKLFVFWPYGCRSNRPSGIMVISTI